jgi:transposase
MSSGAALVLGYIENRAQQQEATPVIADLLRRMQELEIKLAGLNTAEQRASDLQRKVEVLQADNEQLRQTIRRLEIGFRRHISERVSPDQLKLALSGDAAAVESAGPVTPDTDPCPASETEEPEQAPAGSDNAPAQPKNHHRHGRRRVTRIPQVIVETMPTEVLLKGLENFDRIGEEDTSILGYRRGGLIEVVERRPKFVPRARPVNTAVQNVAAAQPAPSPSETNSEPCGAEVPSLLFEQQATAVSQDSEFSSSCSAEDAPAAEFTPSGAQSEPGKADISSIFFEHEVAAVPEGTDFRNNPFVDGALVRYTPEMRSDTDEVPSVLIAPLAERPIARGLPDASLVAHLLVKKLDYHTPYYRQEIESVRQGYPLSRANMARWQYESGSILLRLTDALWQEALARSWFAMDSTGTAIQAEKEYRYGHVFVLVAPGDSVLFRYAPQYDGATVQKLFGGYTPTIVADASANHNVLFGPGKAREAGCWSHARKPFFKAFKAGEGKDAAFALQTIQALFRIEEGLVLLSPEARLEIRQRESSPLVEALFGWADKRLPEVRNDDTFVRKGLVYLTNQEVPLKEFLSNGEVPIHNNASERALRRIVKGRQNWLSHGSDDHAQRACAISSLIASCQLHGLDPEFYLQEVLTVAPSWSLSCILALSPKNWVATRQRLIQQGRLRYIDIARLTGSQIAFR